MRALAFIFLATSLISAGCTVIPASGPAARPSSSGAAVLIVDRNNQQSKNAGRGNGRNGGLPPGIARNLAVGKSLPPGIAKQHVTHNVLLRLPPLSEGYEYVVVAGKILLIAIATQIVHDILEDVLLD
jgi:hypothetical protein